MIAKLPVQIKLVALFAGIAALGVAGYAAAGGIVVAVEIALCALAIAMLVHRWRSPRVPDYSDALNSIHALVNLVPMLGRLSFPFGGAAMEPATLREVLAYIQLHGCRTIVECGSGVSTILLARLIKQGGRGHVMSLEQNPAWAEVVRAAAVAEDLQDWVTVVTTPLEFSHDLAQTWYALGPVRAAISTLPAIDMLIVDGPITLDATTRYPALVVFRERLSPEAVVILDDAQRQHETQIIGRWQQEYALDVTMVHSAKGQAWMRLRPPLEGA